MLTRSFSSVTRPACTCAANSRSETRPRRRCALRWTTCEMVPVLLLELVLVFLDELEVADDRGQRRAQLVRDQGDQVVLEGVDLA